MYLALECKIMRMGYDLRIRGGGVFAAEEGVIAAAASACARVFIASTMRRTNSATIFSPR